MRLGLLASVDRHIDAFFLRMIDQWKSQGVEVSIATGDAAPESDRFRVPHLGRRPGIESFGALRELRRWRSEHDVVLTNTAVASALVRMARSDTPVVYFAHGLHWNKPAGLRTLSWRLIERALLKRTAGVIVLNDEDESWVRQRYRGPIRRLAYGVGLDVSRFSRREPISDPVLRLVWMGEYSARKRPLHAVLLAARLKESRVPFHLEMWGRGALHAEVATAVREASLDSEVTLAGYGDATDAIGSAHALVHTATWEGLPRTILEASAIGRPTFGYDVKGVRGAPATITVPDGDHAAMAEVIVSSWSAGALQHPPSNLPSRSDLDDRLAADHVLDLLREVVMSGEHVRG
jgi:glycosyltransferase involved in cell wall biosynthesis